MNFRKRPAASLAGRKSNRSGETRGRAGRGNSPAKSVEQYLALARTAEAAGDAVGSQNYYQHAEHYIRQINGKTKFGGA